MNSLESTFNFLFYLLVPVVDNMASEPILIPNKLKMHSTAVLSNPGIFPRVEKNYK